MNKKVFSGKRFDVYLQTVTNSDGKIFEKELVSHPGAAVILPILNENEIILIRNFRFAVNRELLELPAGTREIDEAPIETAKRELIEETGYLASNIELLTTFFTTPGFCNEMMYSYVARDLTNVGQQLEESESITLEILSWKKALEHIEKGTICDSKTVNTLLYYHNFKRI